MPIFKGKNEDFFKKWSLEMAYVLGFFAADGNMLKNKRGAHFIEFQSTDKEIIEKIRKALRSNLIIGEYQPLGKNWEKRYRLQIGSKRIFNDLLKLGFTPRKSKTLQFPSVPSKYLAHFIRGYFDGDGCVHLGKYLRKDRNRINWVFSSRFTSGSKCFLQGLWRHLSKIVSGGTLYKKNRGFDLAFSRQDSIALFRLMYDNVSSKLFLERKHDLFLEAFRVLKYKNAVVA